MTKTLNIKHLGRACFNHEIWRVCAVCGKLIDLRATMGALTCDECTTTEK